MNFLAALFFPSLASAASFAGGAFTLHQNQSYSFGSFNLTMQSDGNAVIYQGSNPVWSSGTAGQNCSAGTCLIAFQTDGNFVVYNGSTPLWSSSTGGSPGATLQLNASAPYLTITSAQGSNKWASTSAFQAGGFSLKQNDSFSFGVYHAVMQSDGNFVVSQGSAAVWATQSSSSCNAGCSASFQGDGNLVIYNGSQAIWSSGTGGYSSATLVFSVQEALLEIFSAKGSNVWASTSNFSPGKFVLNQGDYYVNPNGYRVTMQSDGNLVTYNGSTVLYQTGSSASCGANGCKAVYQADGNFVIYNGSQAIWTTSTTAVTAGFLTFQAPYVQIDNIVGSTCRIVYPQAYGCKGGQTTPISLASAFTPTGGALVSSTIGSGGVGGSFNGSVTLGGSNSDLQSNGTSGGTVLAMSGAFGTPSYTGGYVLEFSMTPGGLTVTKIIQSNNPTGDAASRQNNGGAGAPGKVYVGVQAES